MLPSLYKILRYLHSGSHDRKFKQYLEKATQESIKQDLQSALRPIIQTEIHNPWTTFDASCMEDSDRRRYWTKNSLKSHIERTHPGATFSENAIDLLWKCFYFFAHHPFPCELTDKTANEEVDADAFQRAVALLAHQGTRLLGTQETGDYFWRHDKAFFHRANFARVLRSIGHLESTHVLSAFEPPNYLQSVLDDIRDVLATTQPYSTNLAPSPTQLEAVARRLLAEGLTTTTYRLSQTELSTFLVLLLRLRVSNDKWARNCYLGSFVDEDPANEELTQAITARLTGSDVVDFDKALEMMMDALPNLMSRFHQLWTTLFQPMMPDFDVELEPKDENMLSRYLAAASLLILVPEASNPVGLRDRHINYNRLDTTHGGNVLSLPNLVHHLQNDPDSHLILATNLQDPHAPATVIGSFIPSLLCAASDSSSGTRSCKTGDAHLLFQLEPEFLLIRWGKPHTLLKTLIKTNYELASLRAMDAGSGQQTCMRPYYVGDWKGSTARLLIDPEGRSVSLHGSKDLKTAAAGKYREVTSSDTGGKDWEAVVQRCTVHIFAVV